MNWRLVYEAPPARTYRCADFIMGGHQDFLHTADRQPTQYLNNHLLNPTAKRFDFGSLQQRSGCTQQSHFGAVASIDGELVYDNTDFVEVADPKKVFSMADMELRVNDLLV